MEPRDGHGRGARRLHTPEYIARCVSFCGRSVAAADDAASGRATVRRSTACTKRRRPLPAARSTRSIASWRERSSTRSIPAAGCTTHGGARIGFCIYNDVALGVARARDAGHRVLYVDLDVHHGDGTQALFWDDPQVLTLLDPRDRQSAVPGHGLRRRARRHRTRRGPRSTCRCSRTAATDRGIPASTKIVPALADAFKPTFLVSQHGCDTHAYDPLAHLRLTTQRLSRGDACCSTRSPTNHAKAAGSPRAAAATTRTGWCRARGRSSGWRRRTASRRQRPTRAGARSWSAEAERFDQSPPPADISGPPGLRPGTTRRELAEDNKKTAADALTARCGCWRSAIELPGCHPAAGSTTRSTATARRSCWSTPGWPTCACGTSRSRRGGIVHGHSLRPARLRQDHHEDRPYSNRDDVRRLLDHLGVERPPSSACRAAP